MLKSNQSIHKNYTTAVIFISSLVLLMQQMLLCARSNDLNTLMSVFDLKFLQLCMISSYFSRLHKYTQYGHKVLLTRIRMYFCPLSWRQSANRGSSVQLSLSQVKSFLFSIQSMSVYWTSCMGWKKHCIDMLCPGNFQFSNESLMYKRNFKTQTD